MNSTATHFMDNLILEQYATQLGILLQQQNWHLVTAESCTGGWIAQAVTAIAGSSHWFECGFVTYSNRSKQELLGVTTDDLDQYGAVSQQTVLAMLKGAFLRSPAQVGIAVSGIAGPSGGTIEKPVGTVWIAYCYPQRQWAKHYHFIGDRQSIRQQTVITALHELSADIKQRIMR